MNIVNKTTLSSDDLAKFVEKIAELIGVSAPSVVEVRWSQRARAWFVDDVNKMIICAPSCRAMTDLEQLVSNKVILADDYWNLTKRVAYELAARGGRSPSFAFDAVYKAKALEELPLGYEPKNKATRVQKRRRVLAEQVAVAERCLERLLEEHERQRVNQLSVIANLKCQLCEFDAKNGIIENSAQLDTATTD